MPDPVYPSSIEILMRVDRALQDCGVRRVRGCESAENEDPRVPRAPEVTIETSKPGRLRIAAGFEVAPGAPRVLVDVPADAITNVAEGFGRARAEVVTEQELGRASASDARALWDCWVSVVFAEPHVRRTSFLAQVFDTREEADAVVAKAGPGQAWDPKRIEGRSAAGKAAA